MSKYGKALLASMLSIVLFFGGSAWALTLDEAKAAGLVGEQADGYVGAVQSSNEVVELVQDINTRRAAHYREIAIKNNLDVNKVAQVAGVKLIEKAAQGEMIKVNGGWTKKGQ